MHVAVLGAGYAGLTVARRLERRLPDDVDITVVDESDTHLVQHELHRVIRRPALREVITVPLDEVLARSEVRQARITDIDTAAGVATLSTDDGTEELDYDYAAVCLGAETAFYGLSGVEEHAVPLKRLDHAATIRESVLAAPGGEAIVGGGGLSGIQVAGELAALSDAESLDLDVTVVEMADRIAPGFGAGFADAVRTELEARGVRIETGATVESATDDTVHLADGRELGYDTFVWAGGIQGPAATAGERAEVRANLRVSDSTFVVGDAGRIVDETGEAVPAAAQTALREAKVAAANIRRLVRDGEDGFEPRLDTYRYDSPGWVVSVGDGAVAQVGPVVMSGEPAKAAKAVIGAGHLGSVGAIGRASDLVRTELGWPSGDDIDLPTQLLALSHAGRLATLSDPASPGDIQYPLASAGLAFTDVFAPENVDLTPFTRLADRSFPGGPASHAADTLSTGLGLLGSIAGGSNGDDGGRGGDEGETADRSAEE
jgi:NADH dehydrogenase